MPEAADIYGTVFKNGTVTNLARVIGSNGSAVEQSTFGGDYSSSGECGVPAKCSIYLLDDQDSNSRTVIAGHDGVTLEIANVIFDTLQTDDLWTVDDTGYNFRHTIDVCDDPAFEIAGRRYLVEYTLVPLSGQPILVRFRLNCI